MNRIASFSRAAAYSAATLALVAVAVAHGTSSKTATPSSSKAAKSVIGKGGAMSTSPKAASKSAPKVAVPVVFKWSIPNPSSPLVVPAVQVSGGITLGNVDPFVSQLLFTWNSSMTISGGGWASGESVDIVLHGPLNSSITPTARTLSTVAADGGGNIGATAVAIPFDPQPIIRPGHYEVRGVGATSGTAIAGDRINICPATLKNDTNNSIFIDWGRDRGGRDGPLTDIADQAPERIDPDWVATWDEIPVQVYGTVPDTDLDGNNQPAFVAYHDFPDDHYAHDINMMFVPNPEYSWLLGTRNYIGTPGFRETGRMEIEMEFLNDGGPGSYGTGVIGMPAFAMPTGGDSLFVVGRWILDLGHPDTGARTEIHPPRLVAAMRKRRTVMPLSPGSDCMTRAQQVDIYVTPHGGGANRFRRAISDALNNGGLGGGRVSDVLNSTDLDRYYRAGPLSKAQLVSLVALAAVACLFLPPPLSSICIVIATVLIVGQNIHEEAGPSAVGWGAREPELGVVNDMNYDFDVPLLDPPNGATSVQAEVTPQVNDSGAVNEVITYTNPHPVTGLPTKAHIHLPYSGAPNEIYSRTIKFAWNTYSRPGRHFKVHDVKIEVFDDSDLFSGSWQMWLDVCGQWTRRHFKPSTTFSSDVNSMPGVFDVYLDSNQTMRVLAAGYEADNLEDAFGNGFGHTSYDFVFTLLNSYFLYDFSGDNDQLGGAFFQGSPVPVNLITGPHTIQRDGPDGDFDLKFNVTYVPYPARIEVNGVPANFGNVPIGDCQDRVIEIFNIGEEDLDVNQINLTGTGYTLLGPNVPFTVQGGEHVNVTVRFCPTAPGQGAGTITFNSTDSCRPSIVFDMLAVTTYPTISSTPASTVFEPTVVNCSRTQLITVFNTGTAELVVNSASIAGVGYTLAPVTLPIRLAPNGAMNLTVTFTPPGVARAFNGTLTMTTNDPFNPIVTNTFCGEGAQTGIRVIVLRADGTPYAAVDQISVASFGVTPNTNTRHRDPTLTTVLPTESCIPIQYHVEQSLPPTGWAGSQGSYYEVKAKVGNRQQSMSFTLSSCEFRIIVIRLQ